MKKTLEAVMERYGTDLTICHGAEENAVRGFFRAVNSKSWMSMESQASPLGEITRGQYVYMGPADVMLQEGDTILLEAKKYLCRRVEFYYYQNQKLYLWALCVEKGVNDIWGSQS